MINFPVWVRGQGWPPAILIVQATGAGGQGTGKAKITLDNC